MRSEGVVKKASLGRRGALGAEIGRGLPSEGVR